MLFQVPRKTPERPCAETAPQNTFEASLRRDIAGDTVISCNPVVGGWLKRGFDLLVLTIAAPVLAPLALLKAMSRWKDKQPALARCETMGYGGQRFERWLWATDRGEPAHDSAASSEAPLIDRLPQLWNVLRGEMSLVGPLPLAPDEVFALKNGARYYLSARPGVFGVRAVADAPVEEPGLYKAYALSWSLLADSVLLWQELSALRRSNAD